MKDGVLCCTGVPTGYLITKKNDFENYVLSLQWRWPGKGGNNGVLVHVTKPGAWRVAQVPRSAIGSGAAGDLWVIGTTLDIAEHRKASQRSSSTLNLTDGAKSRLANGTRWKSPAAATEIAVKVNGVSREPGNETQPARGAIALQSEGTPIEFRNIKLTKFAINE